MKKWILYLLSLALLLTLLPSCGGEQPADTALPSDAETLRRELLAGADEVQVGEDTVTFTDGSGRGPITVRKGACRVVGLYTSLTTLWYEAGGEMIGCIGGETATALYTEYIGRDITGDAGMTVIATASNAKRWDMERIFALQPDLILCSAAMNGYETVKAPAAAAEIPVVVMEYNDFPDYLKWFKVCCHLTGHPELWESVAMPALERVVEIQFSCGEGTPPRVLALFSGTDTPQANTSATVVGGMLHAMHAVNVADGWGDAERVSVDLEAIYASDPDVILVQCHAGAEASRELVEELWGENPVWLSLRAVREGRVYYLEKELFHNKPNRRFADAYERLAGYLYPNGG